MLLLPEGAAKIYIWSVGEAFTALLYFLWCGEVQCEMKATTKAILSRLASIYDFPELIELLKT